MASTGLVMCHVCWQNDNMQSSMLLGQEFSGAKYLTCYYVWHGKTMLVSVCVCVWFSPFIYAERTHLRNMHADSKWHTYAHCRPIHMSRMPKTLPHSLLVHVTAKLRRSNSWKSLRCCETSLPFVPLMALISISFHWNKYFCENTHARASIGCDDPLYLLCHSRGWVLENPELSRIKSVCAAFHLLGKSRKNLYSNLSDK